MDDVYKILNHVTGDNLFTHALPRASRFAGPKIEELFPVLKVCREPEALDRLTEGLRPFQDRSQFNIENMKKFSQYWLRSFKLPNEYQLPCWSDEWESKDPRQELADEIGEDRVKARCITVDADKLTVPQLSKKLSKR